MFSTRQIAIGAALATIVILAGSAFFFSRDDEADGSGIRGRVFAGCIGGKCALAPVTPTVGLQVASRTKAGPNEETPAPLVRKFWSAKDGTFRVSLPPGYYLINQDPKSPAVGAMHAAGVVVHEGEFTEIDLLYEIPRG